MAANTRTIDDIKQVLIDAKLDESNLEPVNQVVSFGCEIDSNVKLMEINENLLALLNNGDRFTIRGDASDFAVLCTKDKTFEMKEADTSNTLLLSSGLLLPSDIIGCKDTVVATEVSSLHHAYFELRPCRPRFQKLKSLLEQNQYQGRELEDENHEKKYTTEDLLDLVQASEKELEDGLHKLEAYTIEGQWRLLEFDYKFRVVTHILNFAEENSWSLRKVNLNSILDTLSELEPRTVVHQCCKYISENKSLRLDEDGAFAVDEDEICRLFAEVVLRHAGKFALNEFLEAWKLSVPEGLETNLDQLKGLALIERQSFPEYILYFPVSNLPEDENDRFRCLFKMREKWTLDDMEPYIRDITTKNLDVNGLLTKYARTSTVGGIRYYNSKKPVTKD